MKAILRGTRISPKKANLIAGMVRGKKVTEALPYLQYVPKKGASIIYQIVKSATANAENNFGQKKEKLYIKTILVTKGPTYKRSTPISRGRVHPLRKRTSHITIELDLQEVQKKVTAKKDTKVVAAEKKEATPKKDTNKKATPRPKKASA